MMTHTGKRPYQYSKCEKAFLLRCNLICHLRNHTGEKPFFVPSVIRLLLNMVNLIVKLFSYKNYEIYFVYNNKIHKPVFFFIHLYYFINK